MAGPWEEYKPEPKPESKPWESFSSAPKQDDYSFTKRFKETFDPVKAVTEEGLIPQAYGAAKKMITGEKPPKADEFPEKEMGLKAGEGYRRC